VIDITNNQSFCPAPWLSLYAETSGRIDNCCVARNNIGTIETPIEQVLIGEKNIKIQNDMLNNIEVSGCRWCQHGTDNLRHSFLKLYPDLIDPLYEAGKFDLRYLDARWSNTCNLACVYCSANWSSLWAQEVNQVVKISKESKNNLLDYVLNNIESLTSIYMAGGEPLLMKENEILIEELAKRNPQCRILINTNLTNVNTKLYQSLVSLSDVEWLVSFEDMEHRYEYIRYPGNWEQFKSNLLSLLKSVGPQKISFNMVYCNLNYLTFWDTVDWAVSQGFMQKNMNIALYNNGVYEGPLDVGYIKQQGRKQAIERILSQDYSELPGYQRTLDYLHRDVKINSNFADYCRELDIRRNLDSKEIFSDVYQSIESTHEPRTP
jgi:sulfatase maturation enzyme AslB (radical SAM superfamily)